VSGLPTGLPGRLLGRTGIEVLAGLSKLVGIFDDPCPQRNHTNKKTYSQFCEFIFYPRRHLYEIVAREKAISFELA
jgi:hypothetical protein